MRLVWKKDGKNSDLFKFNEWRRSKGSFYAKYQKQPMLEAIFEARIDNALKEEARKDEMYRSGKKETDQRIRKIDKAGLTHRQWKIVDDVLSACNRQEILQMKAAYRLGFKGGVQLICRTSHYLI